MKCHALFSPKNEKKIFFRIPDAIMNGALHDENNNNIKKHASLSGKSFQFS